MESVVDYFLTRTVQSNVKDGGGAEKKYLWLRRINGYELNSLFQVQPGLLGVSGMQHNQPEIQPGNRPPGISIEGSPVE